MRSGWSTRRLTLALYPLATGAMTINLFFLSLIWSWVSGPVLTPWQSVAGGMLIGIPATWACARHLRALMDGVGEASPEA